MGSNAIPGFLPSRHGCGFSNRWPPGPARAWRLGLVHVGIGDVSRGLCGGMAFVARDRFESGDHGPRETEAPRAGTALFDEIVDRQFDSFGRLWTVPVQFWLTSAGSQRRRDRETVRTAWPAIRADIDAGTPSMIGLVRSATANPLALDLGHQVVGYRYDETPSRVAIGIYDPNHPGDDSVEIGFEQAAEGGLRVSQSTGEPVLGLLHLPWRSSSR
jgi:hypothetical protein